MTSNTTLSTISETVSACWCDFNGGALLKPRILIRGAGGSNCSTVASKQVGTLPLEDAVKDLKAVRWLSNAVDSLSSGFTESLLGIKLTL